MTSEKAWKWKTHEKIFPAYTPKALWKQKMKQRTYLSELTTKLTMIISDMRSHKSIKKTATQIKKMRQ